MHLARACNNVIDLAIHCAKNALATLIQGVAPAFRHQLFQQPYQGTIDCWNDRPPDAKDYMKTVL